MRTRARTRVLAVQRHEESTRPPPTREMRELAGHRRRAPVVLRALVEGMLLNTRRLDGFMQTWAEAIPGNLGLTEVMHTFLVRVVRSELVLSIDGGCLTFTRDRTLRIFYRQFNHPETRLLQHIVRHWRAFFAELHTYEGASAGEAATYVTYAGCLLDADVASYFPRAKIAARFVALALRGNIEIDSEGRATPGPYYDAAWTAAYVAVRKLGITSVRCQEAEAPVRRLLWGILFLSVDALAHAWDPAAALHPRLP